MNTSPVGALKLRDEIWPAPDLFPQKIDFFSQLVLFVRLARSDYQAASFLDDRILTPQTQGKWARFETVAGALSGLSPLRPVHFIFHTGHVGSTLLSRLLEESFGVLSLREPPPLRALAEAQDHLHGVDSLVSEAQFETLLSSQFLLWSRGYSDTTAVVVKATSAAARLAPRLLAAHSSTRAIYLNLGLEPYLAALLAGENSLVDLRGHGPERIRRLHRFGAISATPLHAMSAGELAALAWVAESLTQQHLVNSFGARVLSLDFDAVLANLDAALGDVRAHLGLAASTSLLTNIAQSPTIQRYSKAPETPYSPAQRAKLLAETRVRQAEEIAKGRRWVEALGARAPAVATLLTP